jgi:hypothetical protein
MVTISDDRDPTPDELAWWLSLGPGLHPAYKRVWNHGIDVTDEDPSTWPLLWEVEFQSRVRARRSGTGHG